LFNRLFTSAVAVGALLLTVACSAPPAPTPAAPAPTRAAATPAAAQPATPPAVSAGKKYAAAPPMTIDASKKYFAVLHTTAGDIRIELLTSDAPVTVNNFVFLANDHFYDGVKFHRIIKGFMIQTGDPLGNGTGDPGYKFRDEPVKRDYKPGTVAMANSGPNTNGSQFFIMHGDRSNGALPKNYTIFGQVAAGQEVVDKIANTPVRAGGEGSTPVQDVLITGVEIQVQ